MTGERVRLEGDLVVKWRKGLLWVVTFVFLTIVTSTGPVLAYGGGVGGGQHFSSGGQSSGTSRGSSPITSSTSSHPAPTSVPRAVGSSASTIYYVGSSSAATSESTSSGGLGKALLVIVVLILLVVAIGQVSQMASSGRIPFLGRRMHVARLQVALLSTASAEVTSTLHHLIESTDTSSLGGLARLLQDSALLLDRQQAYWHAAICEEQQVPEAKAESAFNQLAMQSRAKLSYETITNVDGQVQVDTLHQPVPAAAIEPGDYVVVNLIVARIAPNLSGPGKPVSLTPDELRRRLDNLAATPADNLRAFEVIWQPDDAREALTRDDLITMYPELVPI